MSAYEQSILEFLDWEEPDDDSFAQDVRIVLASCDFSKELTSTVLWLNDKGIDIRCVKIEPFSDEQRIFLDIQQVIPLPETEQFQVKVRQKKQKEQQARISNRDLSKFTLSIREHNYYGLNKRNLMYQLVSKIIEEGKRPEDIEKNIHWRKKSLFIAFEGYLNEEQFAEQLMKQDTRDKLAKTKRYFCKNDELFKINGKTYAMTNQWREETMLEAVSSLKSEYQDMAIKIERE